MGVSLQDAVGLAGPRAAERYDLFLRLSCAAGRLSDEQLLHAIEYLEAMSSPAELPPDGEPCFHCGSFVDASDIIRPGRPLCAACSTSSEE
jgi:hypothetical protein